MSSNLMSNRNLTIDEDDNIFTVGSVERPIQTLIKDFVTSMGCKVSSSNAVTW